MCISCQNVAGLPDIYICIINAFREYVVRSGAPLVISANATYSFCKQVRTVTTHFVAGLATVSH
jgi:hypothetical protein